MKRVMCIPNYSEGRDLEKVEKIADCFRAKEGLKLVDYQPDKDLPSCSGFAIIFTSYI